MAPSELNIVEAESTRVERWRAETLEKVGFDSSAARELAARPEIDLHLAIKLVETGCPPELALQILI